jgi:hypothetical protein
MRPSVSPSPRHAGPFRRRRAARLIRISSLVLRLLHRFLLTCSAAATMSGRESVGRRFLGGKSDELRDDASGPPPPTRVRAGETDTEWGTWLPVHSRVGACGCRDEAAPLPAGRWAVSSFPPSPLRWLHVASVTFMWRQGGCCGCPSGGAHPSASEPSQPFAPMERDLLDLCVQVADRTLLACISYVLHRKGCFPPCSDTC